MKKICTFLMLTILMSVSKLEASCNDSQILANDIEYLKVMTMMMLKVKLSFMA